MPLACLIELWLDFGLIQSCLIGFDLGLIAHLRRLLLMATACPKSSGCFIAPSGLIGFERFSAFPLDCFRCLPVVLPYQDQGFSFIVLFLCQEFHSV